MKKILFLMCVYISGYTQQITIYDNIKLPEFYIINKIIDNKYQHSYKITNIYNLSNTQIDITRVNNINSYNISESNKLYKKEENNNLYKSVKFKIK